jgi:hypothetical protein
MKKALVAAAYFALAAPVAADPVDLTGMTCVRSAPYGMQTWEFFGDIAINYYADGSFSRLTRVGPGAYEKIDATGTNKGEWVAVYYFFDEGDGIRGRILAKPGLLVRDQNPIAPLEKGVFSFDGTCVPIMEKQ